MTASTDQAKAAAAPRIRLSPHGFSIDHPDPELGEQNARKHGRFTGDAIAERRQIEALLGEARKLLEEMK